MENKGYDVSARTLSNFAEMKQGKRATQLEKTDIWHSNVFFRVSTVPMHVLICGVKCFLLAMLLNQLEISKNKRQKCLRRCVNLADVGANKEDCQECYDWNAHPLYAVPLSARLVWSWRPANDAVIE